MLLQNIKIAIAKCILHLSTSNTTLPQSLFLLLNVVQKPQLLQTYFTLLFIHSLVINYAHYPTQVTVQVTPQVAWKPPRCVHSPDGPFVIVCGPTSTNQRYQGVELSLPSTTQKDGWSRQPHEKGGTVETPNQGSATMTTFLGRHWSISLS